MKEQFLLLKTMKENLIAFMLYKWHAVCLKHACVALKLLVE